MRDKKRSIRFFVLAAILFCMVIFIGSYIFFQKTGHSVKENAQYYDPMMYMGFASEDGIYYKNSTGFLYFFDYQTTQDVIVCNKPNCTHNIWYDSTPDEQRCNAYLPNSLGGAGFVLEDSLYIFHEDLKTQTSSLIQSKPDRTSPKEIAGFENNVISPFVVDRQTLYLSGCAILMEKDEDGIEHPTGENETWIFQLDLETGKLTNLTERKKAYSSDLYIVGICNGKIYYKESYFETMYDGTNYEEANHRVDWYSYDISKGLTERIFEDAYFQEAYLYHNKLAGIFGKYTAEKGKEDTSVNDRYEQIEITVLDLDTGKRKSIVTADKLLDYIDGKVFYIMEEAERRRYYYYDIEKEKTMEMSREFMEHLHVRGDFGDYLMVIQDDPDTGIGEYFLIRKQDFYNEKENYLPISWKGES